MAVFGDGTEKAHLAGLRVGEIQLLIA
jgi:hypothetical protein